MDKIIIAGCEIEYDKIETKKAYEKCKSLIHICNCISCRNYYNASPYFENAIKALFEKFDIDIQKPVDMYDIPTSKDGKLLYNGVYYIVGKIIKSKDNHMYRITDDLEIRFNNNLSLKNENFSKNSFEMEILFWAPWVMDDKNYIKDSWKI